MAILRLEHLTKHYGTFKALDNLNMAVEPNQIYGFIGRNGAGKTTTINLIMRFITQDNGAIYFDGKRLNKGDDVFKKDIAFVPDVPSFPSYLTGYDCLKLTAGLIGLDDQETKRRISDVVQRVDIAKPHHKVGGYSRGMKQRLALACALLKQPKLLLMDEPTSALDPMGRQSLLTLIKSLKQDMTILYSTHILYDAQMVCDRIGLIEKGQLVLEGSVNELLAGKEDQAYEIETMDINLVAKTLKRSNLIESLTEKEASIECHLKPNVSQQDLFALLSKAELTIESIHKKRQSLEDVFMAVLNDA